MVQIGDVVAASWKETKVTEVQIVCVMFMLNRMYFRYASGSSDGENKISMFDLYPSELFSVWIICAV